MLSVGDTFRILTPCPGPPPGLEQLLPDNDKRLKVYKLKQERVNELCKVFPELLQVQDLGDLGRVAVNKVMLARAGAERNSLLDIVVLLLAAENRCNSRADFDDGLKIMFGEKLDAVWRSRLYGSVYHVLPVNGISCFNRKKMRHGAKKSRLGAIVKNNCGNGCVVGGVYMADV